MTGQDRTGQMAGTGKTGQDGGWDSPAETLLTEWYKTMEGLLTCLYIKQFRFN